MTKEIENRLNEIYNGCSKLRLTKELREEVLELEKQLESAAINIDSSRLVTGRAWFIRFAAREDDVEIITKSYSSLTDCLKEWNELEDYADDKWDYDKTYSDYWQMEVTIRPTSSVSMA